MKVFSTIILLLFSFVFCYSQAKKKTLPVKARVNVKIELPPIPIIPNESDKDLWNVYESKKFGFDIIFPAKNEEVEIDERENLSVFEATTKKANYGLVIKKLAYLVNKGKLDEFLEILLTQMYDPKTTKILSKKNIHFGDVLGKEIFFEKDAYHIFGRVFVIENKLYIVSVSLNKLDYKATFDKWALKFLDSFNLQANLKSSS